MPKIVSLGVCLPPYCIEQEEALKLAKHIFAEHFADIERRLQIFHNGQIKRRYLSMPLEWFGEEHTFEEKNNLYIAKATEWGARAIEACLQSEIFLSTPIPFEEIDAIFFVSSTGLSTPSIEARIMNILPFSTHTKRIPIWGLGCAGGAAGLTRAFEYCLAFPEAKVIVLSVELCSLTFQRRDFSKSNLVGSSLFADGVACALVVGEQVDTTGLTLLPSIPRIRATQSTFLPDSEDVMGWAIENNGLNVIFSRDIPSLIKKWLRPQVDQFLEKEGLSIPDIAHFIAHPGGRKVLEAYEETLGISKEKTSASRAILAEYGNMSSATVLYLLKYILENQLRFPKKRGDFSSKNEPREWGLVAALGPGFCSELLLLEWVGE